MMPTFILALEVLQALVDLLLRHARHLAQEGEILLRGEEVDEEALVDIGADMLFPGFALYRIDGLTP